MTSSSERPGAAPPFPNVPPPRRPLGPQSYARFIPREELGAWQPWQPGAIGTGQASRPRTVESPQFSNEQWHAQVRATRDQALAQGREEGLREGRQSGYQDGYRDGLAALEGFKARFSEQTTARVGALLSSLDAQLQGLEPAMAEAVARTAVLLARQVLRQELQTHPQHVSQAAREAVNAIVMSARQIVLHVHPDDVALVEQGAREALDARGARVQPDASLHRGGCRVESDAGSVDATLQARWARACAGVGVALSLDGQQEADGADEADAGTSAAAAASEAAGTP